MYYYIILYLLLKNLDNLHLIYNTGYYTLKIGKYLFSSKENNNLNHDEWVLIENDYSMVIPLS
jgi:hypothetical protein